MNKIELLLDAIGTMDSVLKKLDKLVVDIAVAYDDPWILGDDPKSAVVAALEEQRKCVLRTTDALIDAKQEILDNS